MANQAIRETRSSSESKRPRASADAPRPVCVVPRTGPDRKRRMSEIIARVAEEDRELLLKLAR
jgi:hypothetical protein